ncbi:MAG TPA: hypothetical protein VMV43_00920 [Candidatus Nanopelagicaceae bacterium]|nr:hypothetical protein [Candidatus Nanopelagicaceae bacterium]
MEFTKDVFSKKWKVTLCHAGKQCWCREIYTVDGECIIMEGCINKLLAKYFVTLHNKFLITKNKKLGNMCKQFSPKGRSFEENLS